MILRLRARINIGAHSVIEPLKRAVETGYGLVTVVIAWINAKFWDEEE